MKEFIPPVLPDCLIPDWENNETLQERHAQLQHVSLEDYAADMPLPRWHSGGLHHIDTFKDDPDSIKDETSAIIVPIPFATGWRPHMAARVDLLNAALGGGNRMIALPNSVHGKPATQFTSEERRAFARGDFSPFSEKVVRMLEDEDIENISVAGYSQGSVVGASIAEAVNVYGDQRLEAAALSDTPAVVQRSAVRLKADFLKTGVTSYIHAMDNAAIPLLRQSVEPAGFMAAIADRVRYLRTINIPENQAMSVGLRFATFGSMILHAARGNDAHFGLMRAEHSTVTPKVPYEGVLQQLHAQLPDRVQSVEIPDYGHEFGDHSVALALVEARVLARA
ncbi:MAG TPA: alpha/beta hydrolase [Candidatus Saccharimonadales bacterium]|nr:alpha/beta hydrolase [Candidatus Saccharimonadales bacterium]